MKEEEILPESSKRKANPKNAVGTAIARKRAKTQALGQGGNGSQAGTGIQGEYGHILDLVDYVEEGESIAFLVCVNADDTATGPFMRHFYTLQIALQKRPNRSNIVQATINMSISAADSLLNSVGEKKVAAGRSKAPITLQKKDPEIASVIRSIEYAIELIYLALGKISGSEQSASDVGQVTYHIVRLYDTAMKALEQYCKVKSEQMLAFAKTNSKPSKQKQSAKSKRTEQKPDQEIASQITRLLGTMTLSLDIIYKEHQDLLEGALFILLNRVGRLLCLFVFQDLQLQPDLRADPLKLPLPEGLKHFQLNEKSLCAAKLEARHLIWLLERVLTYFENNPPSQQSQAFTSKVKESLQSTLLQAVYGADDESFKKTLRAPVPPDTLELEKLRVCAQVPEQQVPEWFVQETWRLLGWDMLVAVN